MEESIEIKFYRYEAVNYASIDEFGDFTTGFPNPTIELRTLNLHRETPKGYWIGYGKPGQYSSKGRWVSKTSKKRFAYPTKEEALNNFVLRKTRQIQILKAQLENCTVAISKAKHFVIAQ